MIKVCPLSDEDRAKILDYCEGHRAQVVNEQDVDNCVVIDIARDSIQGAALLTGLKTNAKAKFKIMKEHISIIARLLEMHTSMLIETTISKVEGLTLAQIIEKAEFCASGGDLTPIKNGKNVKLVEVTTDDHDAAVAVVEAWYKTSRWEANITFSDKLEAIRVTVEKDTNAFRR